MEKYNGLTNLIWVVSMAVLGYACLFTAIFQLILIP